MDTPSFQDGFIPSPRENGRIYYALQEPKTKLYLQGNSNIFGETPHLIRPLSSAMSSRTNYLRRNVANEINIERIRVKVEYLDIIPEDKNITRKLIAITNIPYGNMFVSTFEQVYREKENYQAYRFAVVLQSYLPVDVANTLKESADVLFKGKYKGSMLVFAPQDLAMVQLTIDANINLIYDLIDEKVIVSK